MTIEFDTSEAPWLITRFPANWTPAELEAYFVSFSAYLDRDEPYVHISDLTVATTMSSAATRKQAGEFISREAARMRRLCLGAAQVHTSPVIRGALTAIFWISAPPFAQTNAASVAAAADWLRPRVRAAGLDVPPRYRERS